MLCDEAVNRDKFSASCTFSFLYSIYLFVYETWIIEMINRVKLILFPFLWRRGEASMRTNKVVFEKKHTVDPKSPEGRIFGLKD